MSSKWSTIHRTTSSSEQTHLPNLPSSRLMPLLSDSGTRLTTVNPSERPSLDNARLVRLKPRSLLLRNQSTSRERLLPGHHLRKSSNPLTRNLLLVDCTLQYHLDLDRADDATAMCWKVRSLLSSSRQFTNKRKMCMVEVFS